MKKRLCLTLPYIGIPIICIATLIITGRRVDTNTLLQYEMLIIFGYFAALYDIKEKRVPNSLVLVMLAAWIIIIIPRLFIQTSATIALLFDASLGLVIGGGMFLLVYLISRKGLGGGDVKFMAASGLYLGLYRVLPAMLYGTVLAALTGIVLIAMKKITRKDTIPLAPFIYAGILIVIIPG